MPIAIKTLTGIKVPTAVKMLTGITVLVKSGVAMSKDVKVTGGGNPNGDGASEKTVQPLAAGSLDDIARFLAHVVPWPVSDDEPGYVNIHWTEVRALDGKLFWRSAPTKSVAEAVTVVSRLLLLPQVRDIYFCLSLQQKCKLNQFGNIVAVRSKDNAIAVRSIWLDIDVKDPPKGYATPGEAVAALTAFYRAIRLPEPSAVVFSGGGLHVYWTSKTALTPDQWRPLAERLKNAALQHGLRCDTCCTTDCARILRVPDTSNWKGGQRRPVKLLWLGECYEF